MLKKIERKILDFTSLPNVIQNMIEDSAEAASVIDELIELKGETNSLATLILLDDMNIRGVQIYTLYKMCDKDIDKFYNKVTNMTKDDIKKLNKLSAPLCVYKAIFEGTSDERTKHPDKYIFKEIEREEFIEHKQNNTVEKDLSTTIKINDALELLKTKGFKCGYKKEYINNHDKEIYRVFYNKYGDILYTTSLESKNIFLWKDSKLKVFTTNDLVYNLDLKNHPFKTYDKLEKSNSKTINPNLLPIIKTIKGMKYKEINHTYTSCVTADIYDLLLFEQTYNELDDNLKKIYEPLLKVSNDKAYDEIINHLAQDDGIQIAINLQNILGYSLNKSKLLSAKNRYCKARGHKVENKNKKFVSDLFSDDPYTKNMNYKIINVLGHDIEIE